MDSFLSKEVLAGIQKAQARALRQKNRLCVHMGEEIYAVNRVWESGFALDRGTAPRLRGFVDIFDGPKRLMQCLIICSNEIGDEETYEFKRQQSVFERPAADFVREAETPIALLA